MKKVLLLALVSVFALSVLSGCLGGRKRAGYVSKYPNHQRHPCDH